MKEPSVYYVFLAFIFSQFSDCQHSALLSPFTFSCLEKNREKWVQAEIFEEGLLGHTYEIFFSITIFVWRWDGLMLT